MNINEALNVLNLNGTVSMEDIAKAYKRLAIKYHPDRNVAGGELMKIINSAYEFLKSLDLDSVTHTDEKNAYNYSEDLEVVIDEVLKMNGVIIEVCGNWVWLSGETKTYKEQIKDLGFFWASKKTQWYYRPSDHKSQRHKKSWKMEEIRSKYGSSIIKSKYSNLLTA
jgi:curved DNA-binding protein CbpA